MGAQHGADAVGDLAEQVVADVVAPGVVDQLEAVDVEEEQGDVGAVAAGPGEGLLQVVEQERPVGEAGQRVVEGPVGPRGLDPAAVGPVPGHTAQLPEPAVGVALGPQGDLDVDRAPAPAPHGQLTVPGVVGLDLAQDLGVEAAERLGGEEGLQRGLADLGVAEEVLGRPVQEPDPAVVGDAEDGVAARLEDRRRPGGRVVGLGHRGDVVEGADEADGPAVGVAGDGGSQLDRDAVRRRCAGPGTRSGHGSWRVQASRRASSTRSASGPASSGRDRPVASSTRTPVSSPTRGLAQMRRRSSSVRNTPTGTPARRSGTGARVVTGHVGLRGAGQPSSLGIEPVSIGRRSGRSSGGAGWGCYYPRRRNCPVPRGSRRQ